MALNIVEVLQILFVLAFKKEHIKDKHIKDKHIKDK
jgi:hypothetical protein